MTENIKDSIHEIIIHEIEIIWQEKDLQGECVSKRFGSQTMENVALENNIIISIDSQRSSTSKSIAIFLTVDWIGVFIGKLEILQKVWLQLKELSKSFSLSSGMSLSPESKFLVLETKCGIQQKGYRTKCTNTWQSCFDKKNLCRKMLLWFLIKYQVWLFSYSISNKALY